MSHQVLACGIVDGQSAMKQLQKRKEFHPWKKQTFIKTKVNSYFIFLRRLAAVKKWCACRWIMPKMIIWWCFATGTVIFCENRFRWKTRQKASPILMSKSHASVAGVVYKRSTFFSVVKMPIHLPKTLLALYEAKVMWLPMSMRMTPKSSVSICKPAPTASI